MSAPQPGLADFERDLHLIASADPRETPADPRLVEDLDFDLLALAEAVVLIEEKYGMSGGCRHLLTRDWRGVTVSQLFAESRGAA